MDLIQIYNAGFQESHEAGLKAVFEAGTRAANPTPVMEEEPTAEDVMAESIGAEEVSDAGFLAPEPHPDPVVQAAEADGDVGNGEPPKP